MSNFWDLINIEEFDKRDNFSLERWDVSFYCKDCRKLVKAERPDEKPMTIVYEDLIKQWTK